MLMTASEYPPQHETDFRNAIDSLRLERLVEVGEAPTLATLNNVEPNTALHIFTGADEQNLQEDAQVTFVRAPASHLYTSEDPFGQTFDTDWLLYDPETRTSQPVILLGAMLHWEVSYEHNFVKEGVPVGYRKLHEFREGRVAPAEFETPEGQIGGKELPIPEFIPTADLAKFLTEGTVVLGSMGRLCWRLPGIPITTGPVRKVMQTEWEGPPSDYSTISDAVES